MVAKIHDYANSDLPQPVKLAMRLVEAWVLDQGQSIDDPFMDRMREHFDDKQIVELSIAIGTFDFSHRFNAVMGVEPVHPGLYDAGTPGAPKHMQEHLASLGMHPPKRD